MQSPYLYKLFKPNYIIEYKKVPAENPDYSKKNKSNLIKIMGATALTTSALALSGCYDVDYTYRSYSPPSRIYHHTPPRTVYVVPSRRPSIPKTYHYTPPRTYHPSPTPQKRPSYTPQTRRPSYTHPRTNQRYTPHTQNKRPNYSHPNSSSRNSQHKNYPRTRQRSSSNYRRR